MKNTVPWILLGVVIVLLVLFLAMLPARRAQETVLPTPAVQVGTPLAPTSVPTATPVALTPAQEELADLETETAALDADADLDTDLTGLAQELRGL